MNYRQARKIIKRTATTRKPHPHQVHEAKARIRRHIERQVK